MFNVDFGCLFMKYLQLGTLILVNKFHTSPKFNLIECWLNVDFALEKNMNEENLKKKSYLESY